MMKSVRRIAITVGLALLVAALPAAVAFANDSPENQPIHSESGGTTITIVINGEPVSVQATVSVDGVVRAGDFEAWQLVTNPTTEQASLVATAPSNSVVVASFETHPERLAGQITEEQMWERATAYTYSFYFDLHTNAFDGKTAYVYIDHHNGSVETQRSVIEDGHITIYTSLSTYTIVIDMDSGGGINADTGAISPKTGVVGGGICATNESAAVKDTTVALEGMPLDAVVAVIGCAALIGACVVLASKKSKRTHR